MAEGGQSATGELLKHVVTTHPASQRAAEQVEASDGGNIYEYLNSHLEAMQKKMDAPFITYLGRHLFYYGDLFGNRSPVADPHMTGAVIGLTNDTSIDALALQYYGAMEFIALQTHQIIQTMNQAGHQVRSIFMSGTQCQNKILMHLIASACHLPVIIPQYVHAAVVHGAAMLAAKAASADRHGNTEPLWDVMLRMSKPGTAVHPTSYLRETQLLEAKYGVFLEQCRSQREYRGTVDRLVEKWSLPQTHG